jgi:lysyl-tRNA synthetase class I
MTNISEIILKSGLQSLIYENDDAFKRSLINTLSFKLNEALKEVNKSLSSNILFKDEKTEISEDVKTLIEFFENYNPKTNYSLKLKNNVNINISEQDLSKLKKLFNSFNSENRKIMAKELLENSAKFKNTLNFYENVKGLI